MDGRRPGVVESTAVADRNPTEAPTAKRLARARRDGDHPLSSALVGVAALAAGLALLPLSARALVEEMQATLTLALSGEIDGLLEGLPRRVAWVCLPVLFASSAGALVAGLWQTGGIVSFRPIRADARRLDPLRPFRTRGMLGPVSRCVGMLSLLATAAWVVESGIRGMGPALAASVGNAESTLALILRSGRHAALALVPALLAWAVVDALVSRELWLSRLRMTRDEILRERRDDEGNPELAAARQRAHRELSRDAEDERLGRASLLVTDGKRLATALLYDARSDAAPHVVVQAVGARTEGLLERARSLGTLIWEESALATELSWVAVGDEIPPSLYAPVAEAMREGSATRGEEA